MHISYICTSPAVESSPTYICDLATPVNEIRGRSHLRSATLGHFDVPRTRTRLGSRAFSVAGPAAWNSPPIKHPITEID